MRTKPETGAVVARREVVSVVESLQGVLSKPQTTCLADMFAACLTCKHVQLTAIGRTLPTNRRLRKASRGSGHSTGPVTVKANIDRVNEFLGNPRVHKKLFALWRAVMAPFFVGLKTVRVLVDWTGGCPGSGLWILSAAVAFEGRAVRVYEKVVPVKNLDNPKVNRAFLSELKQALPPDVAVTIVTDAGFKIPFFKAVLAQGWDFLGRVRGNVYSGKRRKKMFPAKRLIATATRTPRMLQDLVLSKAARFTCARAVLYKAKAKGRKDKSRKGTKKRGNHREKYSKNSREGWLLATSLTDLTAQELVDVYAKRMSHEEAFRDLKSSRFGLALKHSRTKKRERLTLLCLIGALAALVLYKVGRSLRGTRWAYSLQANTVRDRNVFSVLTLASYYLQMLDTRTLGELLDVGLRPPI